MALVMVPLAGEMMLGTRDVLVHDVDVDGLCERSSEKQSRDEAA